MEHFNDAVQTDNILTVIIHELFISLHNSGNLKCFLCDIRQAVFNPNLFPYENMEGKIDRPEEYADIATKCVTNFREKNRDRCLVVLSRQDEALDSQRSADLLHHYYEIIWDEEQTHKFKNISPHLQRLKAFKTLG